MKKLTLAVLISTFCFSASMLAEEQESVDRVDESERLTVTWVNPKEFTDVKPSGGIASRFRDRTMENLHEYLDDLASDLPAGQKLTMKVTDLDLAGRVWPGAREYRLIKSIEIPRMDFSYQLVDADGTILKSGTEELKDMSFMSNVSRTTSNDSLKYEKTMLKDWFRKEFKQELLASNH
ncbi:DUF3016 domain-containing protein [Planctobacterium marinum]|uniref:DUF3016 domain-containing protein n=1 Tax=Planctobacterium marinum TaxID=1631968 RepID=UPI001E291AA6|nr:DUF3016 domain-containing protein [Planctobacterium marinum]MCC2607607.1 DUF3016 domain-containing protein [Planctobacterium marinum]